MLKIKTVSSKSWQHNMLFHNFFNGICVTVILNRWNDENNARLFESTRKDTQQTF